MVSFKPTVSVVDADSRSSLSEDDARSIHSAASTVATTASLASRIASLALGDFSDFRQEESVREDSVGYVPAVYEDDEEEKEEVVEITEAELLAELDRQEPAFRVRLPGTAAWRN
jgi:hypothetical protein